MSAKPALSTQEELEWEARRGPVAAGAAFAAAILAIVALPVRAGILKGDLDERLISIHAHEGRFIASGILESLSALALVGVVTYLYRSTKARREQLMPAALPLAVGGAVAFALAQLGTVLVFTNLADDFSESRIPTGFSKIKDPQAYLEAIDPLERANRLVDDSPAEFLGYLLLAGVIALGFSLILLSLNAMRAGLLSRFMGILGIVLAVLFVLGGGTPPVIYGFWLAALGVLFLDRWPNGRGPAWETGEAVRWPTAAELRGEVPDESGRREEEEAAEDDGPAEEEEGAPRPRPVSRKRKRKNRR